MSAYKPTPPEPVSSRGRQVKASKGHNMLSAGFRRLRTLSGAYHGRSSSDLTDDRPPPVPALNRGSSDQNHAPWHPSSRAPPRSFPFRGSVTDSGPLPPSLSQLRGIHFVPDAKQDPDLDQASTTNESRPQSTQSGKSSAASALDDITNSSADQNPSFAVSWSETRGQDSSSSPSSLSTFDSSTGGSSAIGDLLQLICPITTKTHQLSPRACQAAYPPIDLQSPYAPYAPTSPLSATSVQNSNSSAHNHGPTISTFNMRMGLRHLPSIVPKPLARHHAQSHPMTTQQQPGSPPSTLDFHVEQSDSTTKIGSPRPSSENNGSPLIFPVYAGGSDQSSRARVASLQSRLGNEASATEPTTPKSRVFKGKLGWSGKAKHQHSRSVSISRPGSIPFPCATHDDAETAPTKQRHHERNCSEGAKTQRSKIWILPINRIRTSSSISTLIRGMRSNLRHNPSETSFEARPFSVRTESFYEILDASAIPPCDNSSIPN